MSPMKFITLLAGCAFLLSLSACDIGAPNDAVNDIATAQNKVVTADQMPPGLAPDYPPPATTQASK